jgi:hypothetical protein
MANGVSERTDRIRARQAGVNPTNEEIAHALFDFIAEHEDHPWRQVGRCVYCGPCGVRLYQGTIPKDHPIAPAPPRRDDPATEMLRRWLEA